MAELTLHEISIEANQGRLAILANTIARLAVDAVNGMVIDIVPFEGDESIQTIVSGAVTAGDIIESYGDEGMLVEAQDAEELAQTANDQRRTSANVSVTSLVAQASLFYVFDMSNAGRLDEVEPRRLVYTQGSQQLGYYDEADGLSHQVRVTTIEGVEHVNKAREYEVDSTDGLVVQRLSITEVNHRIRSAKLGLTPVVDSLVERCVRLFGKIDDRLFNCFVGQFETTEQLDETLNEIGRNFQGASQEDEVGLILREVRIRSLARKESAALNVAHNTDMPTPEKLDTVTAGLALL